MSVTWSNLAEDEEAETVSEYDFDEDAMGLGGWITRVIDGLPDHEIVVTVMDEQGRRAKSAKFMRDDFGVNLFIVFDRELG